MSGYRGKWDTVEYTKELQNELAERAYGGDEEALNELLPTIIPLIIHKAAKSKAKFRKREMDDMIQDCILKVITTIQSSKKGYDKGKKNFSNYIGVILDNHLMRWETVARPYECNWNGVAKLPATNGARMYRHKSAIIDGEMGPEDLVAKYDMIESMAQDICRYARRTMVIADINPNDPEYIDDIEDRRNEINKDPCVADLQGLIKQCCDGDLRDAAMVLAENKDDLEKTISITGLDRKVVSTYKREYKKRVRQLL